VEEIVQITLAPEEQAALQKSANDVKQSIAKLRL